MEKRNVTMTVDQAKELYKSNPEFRNTILSDFTDKELDIDDFPKSWEDIDDIGGFYVDEGSGVVTVEGLDTSEECDKNVDVTKEDCEAYLAGCQLRQLAKVINDSQTERDWIDWQDNSQIKYSAFYALSAGIFNINSSLQVKENRIYFKRKEDLKRSLKEHKNLWLTYFKIK